MSDQIQVMDEDAYRASMESLGVGLPRMSVPEYRVGQYGEWELLRSKDEPEFPSGWLIQRGFYTTLVLEPHFYVLRRNGQNWMCTGYLEQESHQIHVKHATGTVLVGGAGLGLYLYNILSKPNVTNVIVVEHDQEVLDLLEVAADLNQWPGAEKLTTVRGDIKKITREWLASNGFPRIDYLYVDIWPVLANSQALPDVKLIQGAVGAANVGWWGQELDFLSWVIDERSARKAQSLVPTLADWDNWVASLGFNIPERSDGYVDLCLRAGITLAHHSRGTHEIKEA